MFSGRNLFALMTIALLTLGLAACGDKAAEEAAQKAAQDAEAWDAVQQAKAALDAKRDELTALEEQLAASEDGEDGEAAAESTDGEATEGEEGAAEGETTLSPAEQLEAAQKDAQKLSDELTTALTNFINTQEIYEGEPLTDLQRQAFDLKAGEDILIAKEYIEKAGDYQRAIDIYTNSLLSDPENELLLTAREEAEALRYMTEERFAEVKKDMSEEDVRATLGTPMRQNVREFEKGVVGWFYPKEEPNTAAAVFFQDKKGEKKVYKTDFEAVKAPTETEGE